MSRTYRGRGRKQVVSRRGSRRWKPKATYGGHAIGQGLEERVESALVNLVAVGKIDEFEHHTRNSEKDHEGVDFTVVRFGRALEFDVTSSYRAWRRKMGDPQRKSLYFSQDATREQIGDRIASLFDTV